MQVQENESPLFCPKEENKDESSLLIVVQHWKPELKTMRGSTDDLCNVGRQHGCPRDKGFKRIKSSRETLRVSSPADLNSIANSLNLNSSSINKIPPAVISSTRQSSTFFTPQSQPKFHSKHLSKCESSIASRQYDLTRNHPQIHV